MKLILSLAFLLTTACGLIAQCSDVDMSALQVLANTAPASKEAKILKLGFDLDSESGKGATNTRHYRKCWHANIDGSSVFRQVILWRTNINDITFMTLDESSFTKVKNEIDQRHKTGGDRAVVVGKKFRYSFHTQDAYGLTYYAVTVALKSGMSVGAEADKH
ncbi:MAG: hypothetical protein KF734_15410 [Saprospiraceae bacterium]|nr:hypothetical protein [Saprospiraceae bacterium]MCW5920967.1 hypothetical protein [Saprospiraceae bacterium]